MRPGSGQGDALKTEVAEQTTQTHRQIIECSHLFLGTLKGRIRMLRLIGDLLNAGAIDVVALCCSLTRQSDITSWRQLR